LHAAYAALCYDSDRDASSSLAGHSRIAQGLDDPDRRGRRGARSVPKRAHPLQRACVRVFAIEGMYGLAAVAASLGDGQRAARLFGAAAAHGEGDPADPVKARLNARFFEPARKRCGTDAWNAALRDGAALSFEDAIGYALDEANASTDHASRPSQIRSVVP
jgi:hypothetical protein